MVTENRSAIFRPMLKVYKKSIASLALLSFFVSSLLPPDAFAISLELPSQKPQLSLVPVGIPPELASIKEIFLPPHKEAASPLIHIQSVHAHPETQRKIYELLKFLNEKSGVQALFIEGAGETLNPDYFRFFDDNRQNIQVAQKLIEKGEMTGAELFLIESKKKIPAYGIEDPGLYREDLESFQKVMLKHASSGRFLKEVGAHLDRLETLLLTPDVRRLLASSEAFDAGRLELLSYVLELERKAEDLLEVDLRHFENQLDWPQLIRLLRLQEIESSLDLEQITKEKERLLEFLRRTQAPLSVIEGIEKLSFSPFQTGTVFEPGFPKNDLPRYLAERLVAATLEKGFSFEAYPYFTRYLEASILQSELEAERLFAEIEKLLDRLLRAAVQKEDELKLVDLARQLKLFERLFNLELTPKDHAKMENLQRADRPLIRFLLALESLHQRTSLGPVKLVPSNVDELETLHSEAFRFYELAKKREQAMVEKIVGAPRGADDLTVLITGGFHTSGLSQAFRKREIAYMILSPRIMEVVSSEAYISTLLGQKPSAFDAAHLEPMIKAISSAVREEMSSRNLARGEVPHLLEALFLTALEQKISAEQTVYIFNESAYAKDRGVSLVFDEKKTGVFIWDAVLQQPVPNKNGVDIFVPVSTLNVEIPVLGVYSQLAPVARPSARARAREQSKGPGLVAPVSPAKINKRAEVHSAPTGLSTPQYPRRLGARAEVRGERSFLGSVWRFVVSSGLLLFMAIGMTSSGCAFKPKAEITQEEGRDPLRTRLRKDAEKSAKLFGRELPPEVPLSRVIRKRAPLNTTERILLGSLVVAGSALSVAHNRDERDLNAVLAFDLIGNGLIAATGHFLNGEGDFEILFDDFLWGSGSGLVMFSGKELMSHKIEEDGWGFPAKFLHSAGASIRDNVMYGRDPLERFEVDIGPFLLGLDFSEGAPGVDFALLPHSFSDLAETIIDGNRFDWETTHRVGTLAFLGEDLPKDAHSGIRAAGVALSNLIIIDKNVELFDGEAFLGSLRMHEAVHAAFQYREMNFLGAPFDRFAHRELGLPEWIRLDFDLGNFFTGSFSATEEEHDKRFNELEAEIWQEKAQLRLDRSEVRVKIEIEGPTPGRPIVLEVPEAVAADVKRLRSWQPTYKKALAKARKLLQLIQQAKQENNNTIWYEYVIQPENEGIFFWSLEHFSDPAFSLSKDEKVILRSFVLYEIDSLPESFWLYKEAVSLEDYEFLLVTLLALESRVEDKEHLALIEDSYRLVLGDLTSAYLNGELSLHPKNEFFEEHLLDLTQKEPGLGKPITKLLQNWETWAEEYRSVSFSARDALSSRPEELTGEVSGEKVVETLVAQQKLAQELRELQAVLTPRNPEAIRAWNHPLAYLRELVQGKELVFFKTGIAIDETWSKKELPNAWLFQLDWLEAMGKLGFKDWALTNFFAYFFTLQEWLNKIKEGRSREKLLKELQSYFNLKRQNAPPPLRTFLHLPEEEEPLSVTLGIRFFEKLWDLKESVGAQVTFLDQESWDGVKHLFEWIENRKGKKRLSLGISPKRVFQEKPPDSAWIQHSSARSDYSAEEFLIDRAFSYVSYLIGKARGWGDRESAALPIRRNRPLFDLFYEGTLKEERGLLRFLGLFGWRMREELADALVMSSESEGEENEAPVPPEEVNVSSPKLVPVGPAAPASPTRAEVHQDSTEPGTSDEKIPVRSEVRRSDGSSLNVRVDQVTQIGSLKVETGTLETFPAPQPVGNLLVVAPLLLSSLARVFQARPQTDVRIFLETTLEIFQRNGKPNPLMDPFLAESGVGEAVLEVLKQAVAQGTTSQAQIESLLAQDDTFSAKFEGGAFIRKQLEEPGVQVVVLNHLPSREELWAILLPAVINPKLFIEILLSPEAGATEEKVGLLRQEASDLLPDAKRLEIRYAGTRDQFKTEILETASRLHAELSGTTSGVSRDLARFIEEQLVVNVSEGTWEDWGLETFLDPRVRTVLHRFGREAEDYLPKFGAVSLLASKLAQFRALSEPQKKNYFEIQGRRYRVKEEALYDFLERLKVTLAGLKRILAAA